MKHAIMVVMLFSLVAGLTTPMTGAVGKGEALETIRAFLVPFLGGEYDAAADHAVGDFERWAPVLANQLPGDGPVSVFDIVELRGDRKKRTGTILIGRGEAEQVFYVDVDESGKVTRFYSILEISAPYLEMVNATAKATADEILRWGSKGQDKNAFINTLEQQIDAANAYRSILDHHIRTLRHLQDF